MNEQLEPSANHENCPQHLSRDEAVTLYPGQWVLMRVTEVDSQGWPAKGEILAHASNERDVIERIPLRNPSAEPSATPYYCFMARPLKRSGPGFDPEAATRAERINARLRAEHAATKAP